MPASPTIGAVLLWVVAGLAGGCGDGRPEVVPVSGKITLDGKPIGPGDIVFVPDTDKNTRGKAAMGSFAADGQYSLTTFEPGDGVIAGHHKVVITPRPEGVSPGDEFPANADNIPPIPAKYGNLARPLLSALVEPGGGSIDFDLVP